MVDWACKTFSINQSSTADNDDYRKHYVYPFISLPLHKSSSPIFLYTTPPKTINIKVSQSKILMIVLFLSFMTSAKPENVHCGVSETPGFGHVTSVMIYCSTIKVYPQAKCSFYRRTCVSIGESDNTIMYL